MTRDVSTVKFRNTTPAEKRDGRKATYVGMDAPDKLRFYLKEKKFSHELFAQLIGHSIGTVGLWTCSYGRPNLVTQYTIEYLTRKCGDVMVADWKTAKEKEKIEEKKTAIRRLRRHAPIQKPTARDRLKGRL